MKTTKQILLEAPFYRINLINASDPKYITQFFKKNNIEKSVYRFTYDVLGHNTTMKYGQSIAEKSVENGILGERVYRQARWAPGWGKIFKGPNKTMQDYPSSTNGNEMEKLIANYFPGIDKNDISIEIYDLSGFTKKKVKQIETWIMGEHNRAHGFLPPGNVAYNKNAEYAPIDIESICSQSDKLEVPVLFE